MINFIKNIILKIKSFELDKLKQSGKKIIFFGFFIILGAFVAKQSLAKEFKSNADAIDQIEKILSIPAGSVVLKRESKINIDKTTKKDEATAETQEYEEESGISIEVIEKRDNKANRLKEKLAFNATISGQYEVAKEIYKQILKTEKGNHYAKFGLATSYHKLKQFKQAKQIYYELLFEDIENKDEVIGNFLEILVEESPKDAKYILARLSAQNPNSDYILARSALVYNKLGQAEEAILLMKRAVALKPTNNEYQLNLAIILDKNDEKDEALRYYKKVLSNYLSSGNINRQQNLQNIRQRINFIEKQQ